MGKHARNANSSMVYTAYERQKDKAAGQYGRMEARLGRDSLQPIDCCCLTLQPCTEPVLSPHGFLYDKAAIVENLVHQKAEIARKLKAYEMSKEKKEKEDKEKEEQERLKKIQEFERQEMSATSRSVEAFEDGSKGAKGHAAALLEDADKHKFRKTHTDGSVSDAVLPAFWMPSMLPDARNPDSEAKSTERAGKPSEKTVCPMSGQPMRFKDLIPVKFTPANKDSTESMHTREERFMCPISRKAITGALECAVLKPTGVVVTMECVNKVIKPDMVDPLSGKKLKESDIIRIHQGTSGFAGATGDRLKAQKVSPAMAAM